MQQKRPDMIRMNKACRRVFAAGVGKRAVSERMPWRTPLVALFMLVLMAGGAVQAEVQRYDCVGEVKSENIFMPDSATLTTQHFALALSLAGNYLKRDATLAAGCLMPRIEICQCALTPERITCRSFGLNPRNGEEVSADFTLAPDSGDLQFQARRFSPASGALVETQGQLICTIVEPTHPSGTATP